MNLSLKDKTALVCGSSQGIGKAIALQFAKMGANVILMARNKENLELCLNELANDGSQQHSYIQADFNSPDETIEKVKTKLDEYKSIHILVNNAGGPAPSMISEAQTEDLESAFRQHIIISQSLSQLLIEGMKNANYGRIINIISIGLKQPIENLGVSNVIRGAMGSWAKTLSRELAQYGITVNNILPGYTLTQRLSSLFEHRAKLQNTSPEQIKSNIENSIPTKRIGNPVEIAYAAGFLASSQASFINGVSLPVDGGFLSSI